MAEKQNTTPENDRDFIEADPRVAVIHILGQRAKFPVNRALVVIICVLVTGLVAIEYISRGVTQTINSLLTGSYVTVSSEGIKNGSGKATHIYQFWTPGESTWEEVQSYCLRYNECSDNMAQYAAAYTTTAAQLEKFGRALKKELGVPGYTRFHVVGAGPYTGDKTGWVWKIVMADGKQLDRDAFFKIYSRFFNRSKVAIEESVLGGK